MKFLNQRFKDVPSAMPYTLILLSGDYPLLDFTFWGKVCLPPVVGWSEDR